MGQETDKLKAAIDRVSDESWEELAVDPLVNIFLNETGSEAVWDDLRMEERREFIRQELKRAETQINDYFGVNWLSNRVRQQLEAEFGEGEQPGDEGEGDGEEDGESGEGGEGEGDSTEEPTESAAESFERVTGRKPMKSGGGEASPPPKPGPEQDMAKDAPATTLEEFEKQIQELREIAQQGVGGGAGDAHGTINIHKVRTKPAKIPQAYLPVIDDLSPSADVLDTSGMAGDSAWEVNIGNLRVFETVEEDKTNLLIAVDCSGSVGHTCGGERDCETRMPSSASEVGWLEWAAANILAKAAPRSEMYGYRGGFYNIDVMPVQVGHKLGCGAIGGGTPDDRMLEFMSTRIRGNMENTVSVFICDGGPGNFTRTREIATELYHAGMRFIYIIVGPAVHWMDELPYPADLLVPLETKADLVRLGPAIARVKDGYLA